MIDEFARRAWLHGWSPERYRRTARWSIVLAACFAALGVFLAASASWQWAAVPFIVAAGAVVQSVTARLIAARLQELYEMTGKPQPKKDSDRDEP